MSLCINSPDIWIPARANSGSLQQMILHILCFLIRIIERAAVPMDACYAWRVEFRLSRRRSLTTDINRKEISLLYLPPFIWTYGEDCFDGLRKSDDARQARKGQEWRKLIFVDWSSARGCLVTCQRATFTISYLPPGYFSAGSRADAR